MNFFLDTNVWSYLADHDAGPDLVAALRAAKANIVVSPAIVDEVQQLPNAEARNRVVRLVTHPHWKRLTPEVYNECEELKAEIRRTRPEWIIPNPRLSEVRRLRYDWVRRSGGFWDRARRGVVLEPTNESLRRDREDSLAIEESFAIRQRMTKFKSAAGTHLQHVGYMPDTGTPGWLGKPVHYWRVPSLHFFARELQVYESAVREWLGSEVNLLAMLDSTESMNRLWLHELDPAGVPRQWLRGAFEFLQAWHKVTNGTPGDSRLATHLLDADVIVSADKNFVRFAERCRLEAPFAVGQPVLIPAAREGVDELIKLISS